MNKDVRKKIQDLIEQLDAIKTRVEELRDDEDNKYSNLPDSLQSSEKGEKMQEAIDNLDSAFGSIEETMDFLQEAMN